MSEHEYQKSTLELILAQHPETMRVINEQMRVAEANAATVQRQTKIVDQLLQKVDRLLARS